MNKGKIHLVIGDTQCKPGARQDHLRWIGQYILDQFVGQDLTIVNLGDHWDLPSLSSYDRGKREMEGRRYKADIAVGNEGLRLLDQPTVDYNKKRRHRWKPKKVLLRGNHEERRNRAMNDAAELEGALEEFDDRDWEVHEFLEVVDLDGISYSHYFYNPNTGRPYCGENMKLRLKTIGRSFTQGHQQGCDYGHRPVGKSRHHGLVLGSTYLHDEKYLGPQGNDCWRGIVVCHQVERGQYDPMFVSLEYLCRRYENKTLKEFLK